MPKSTLRVYGWRGWRTECPPAPNGSRQTREIVAATSMAAAARAAGVKRPSALDNLCETGNEEEIRAAMAKPGAVLWRPLNESRRIGYREAAARSPGPRRDA